MTDKDMIASTNNSGMSIRHKIVEVLCENGDVRNIGLLADALETALSTDADPVAWYWEDATGCFHITLDRPDVKQMAAIVGCKPKPLYAAPPTPSVAVKALEWKSRGRKNGDTYADSVVGQYSVGDIWGEIKSLLRTIVDGQDDDQVLGVHGSFEEAKAAAQSDYEARIRSALSAQVQDVAIPEGWQLVPKEPTLDMVNVGEEAFENQLDRRLTNPSPYPSEEKEELSARAAYRAMLSAAPAAKLEEKP